MEQSHGPAKLPLTEFILRKFLGIAFCQKRFRVALVKSLLGDSAWFMLEPGGLGNPQRKIIACRAIMELTMSACAVVRQLRERP